MKETGWLSPASLFQFPWKIFLYEVLEVFASKAIPFILESAREHPLDFRLPGRFLEPQIVERFFRTAMSF